MWWNDLDTYFENKTGRRALGDGTLTGGWMSVTVTVRAEVTTHLWLDVPVVHLHVHYLHEFDSRGQFLDLLLSVEFKINRKIAPIRL